MYFRQCVLSTHQHHRIQDISSFLTLYQQLIQRHAQGGGDLVGGFDD
jgi:hypothetical protein